MVQDELGAHGRKELDWHASTKSHAPSWYSVPQNVAEAADGFDARHRRRLHCADRALRALLLESTSARKEKLFDLMLDEVRRNRFFVDKPFQDDGQPERREHAGAQAKGWMLETSIWAPRKKTSDSKAFYDTDECERAMFDFDWAQLSRSEAIPNFIAKWDHRGAAAVKQAQETLRSYQDVIYHTFDLYACLGTSQVRYWHSSHRCSASPL